MSQQTVFLVESDDYREDRFIVGIYATHELALEGAKAHLKGRTGFHPHPTKPETLIDEYPVVSDLSELDPPASP